MTLTASQADVADLTKAEQFIMASEGFLKREGFLF